MAALQSYIADLTQVTPADLQALARRYLTAERAVQIHIVPAASPAGSDVAP
jgi:predicted Zn-dependent peptidase